MPMPIYSPPHKPGELGARAIRLVKYFRVWHRLNRHTLKGFQFDPNGENLSLDLRLGELAILFLFEGIGDATYDPNGAREQLSIAEWEELNESIMVERSILNIIDSDIAPVPMTWGQVRTINFDIPELFKLRKSTIPPAIQTFCRLLGV